MKKREIKAKTYVRIKIYSKVNTHKKWDLLAYKIDIWSDLASNHSTFPIPMNVNAIQPNDSLILNEIWANIRQTAPIFEAPLHWRYSWNIWGSLRKPLTNAETDAMLSFMQLWHCCHFKYDGIRLKHYWCLWPIVIWYEPIKKININQMNCCK